MNQTACCAFSPSCRLNLISVEEGGHPELTGKGRSRTDLRGEGEAGSLGRLRSLGKQEEPGSVCQASESWPALALRSHLSLIPSSNIVLNHLIYLDSFFFFFFVIEEQFLKISFCPPSLNFAFQSTQNVPLILSFLLESQLGILHPSFLV